MVNTQAPTAPNLFADDQEPSAAEFGQIVALLHSGDYAGMEGRANAFVERYPASGNIWKALGVALAVQGKNALPALQKAAELLPGDAEAHSNLGNALQSVGQLGDAAESHRKALSLKPDSAEAHNNLGNVLKSLGQPDEAAASYRRAVELKPGLGDAHYNLGLVLQSLGQLDAAEASYRRALELKPDFAEGHTSLGNILRRVERFDEAAASYRRVLELKPDFAEAHNNLGSALKDLGKLDDAARCYRRALEIQPDFAEAHNNLGAVLRRQGKPDEAIACFRQALSINPELVRAHMNMSQVLFETGCLDEAQQHRDLAYGKQCLFFSPFLPTVVRTVLMLFDVVAGNVPYKFLVPGRDNNRISWFIEYATEDQYRNLPPYDVVFNAIGDPDVTGAVGPLARFMRTCDKPVLNAPAAVARTSRHLMAELFDGVEGVLIPAAWRVEQRGSWFDNPDFQFPVLVRPPASHGGQGLTLVESRAALAGRAQESTGVIHLCNYHDYRSPDGHFRKYRIIFVDRKPYPYHLAISEQWMVHYQTANMLLPWKLEEERRFLEDPAAVLGATGMAAIEAIGRRLDLDYAGVDFSILPDGRLLIFEANATMLAHPEQEDALAFKNPYVQRIFDAFGELLARASSKGQTDGASL